ncbi:MAG: HYExAFE family protein [Planctomycetes bacterium]|nr:HYExAFE family protein [Planctomycetota bacterium]
MKRTIHYEAAFESFLRERGTPYVAVDEAKRALFGGVSLKSFDFVVYSSSGVNLLVDVKGRKFPYVTRGQKRFWENWVERDDLANLATWEEVFGRDFQGMFVFAYVLGEPGDAEAFTDVHRFRDEWYAFVAIAAELYGRHCRLRSPSWQTVNMPTSLFRELLAPVSAYL